MTTQSADPIKTTPESSSPSKKKKNKSAKKKRHVSKHILQAQKDRESLGKARKTDAIPTVTEADASNETSTTDAATKKAPHHVKDVKEAAGYLTNWKNYRQQWKFNKNTQSWLIRHMYESEKVAKGTFTLLLEYLQGLQGNGAKQRLLKDATRRALRYKEYSEQHTEPDNGSKDKETNDKNKKVQFSEDTKASATDNAKNDKKQSSKERDDATEDEKRWNSLTDHDKRKEYKRARKILETLQGGESN